MRFPICRPSQFEPTVTDRLSRTVFEILSFKDIGVTTDLSDSRDVISHVT